MVENTDFLYKDSVSIGQNSKSIYSVAQQNAEKVRELFERFLN